MKQTAKHENNAGGINGQLPTLAYGHRLADKHLAGFFARKIVIEVRQVVRPHAARAHSLYR